METVTLLIIAKTHWAGGFCYLGYDPVSSQVLRPVTIKVEMFTAKISPLPREPQLQIGQWYRFHLMDMSGPVEPNSLIVLPHSNDDRYVTPRFTAVQPPLPPQKRFDLFQQLSQLYTILQRRAKDKLEDIYNLSKVFNKRYVHGGTDCTSVGVLRCKKRQLQTYQYQDKKPRIKIQCIESGYLTTYDFPFNVLDEEDLVDFNNTLSRPDEDVLVLFSTARPFSGYPPENIFDPPRCYILVVGLVRKLTNPNQIKRFSLPLHCGHSSHTFDGRNHFFHYGEPNHHGSNFQSTYNRQQYFYGPFSQPFYYGRQPQQPFKPGWYYL